MSNATIRVATVDDLPALLGLMRGYYRDDGLEFDVSHASTTMGRLLREPQWGFALLLEAEGSAAGYVAVCLGFSLELGGNDAFIDEVFVQPAQRGKGHGTKLLNAAAMLATQRGVRALHLEVDRGNASARDLYASLGYGLRDRYYLMTRLLDPASTPSSTD